MMLRVLVSYLKRAFVHVDIGIEDVERMKLEETAEKIDAKFHRAWHREVVLTKREHRPPSLLSMIHQMYFWTIYLTGFGMLLLHLVTVFLFPHLVEFFITYLIGSDEFKYSERIVWFKAVGLFSCAFVISTFKSSLSENLKNASICIKSGLSCLIFRKIMRMKKGGVSEERIIKLVSEDTERVGQGVEQVHSVWLAGITLFTVSRALYKVYDYHTGLFSPFVPGLIIIAVTTMLHSSKLNLCSRIQSRIDYLSSLRRRLTKDVVVGLNTIIVNIWEKPYMMLFERLRTVEVQQLQMPALATAMMSNTSFSHVHVLVLLCSVVSTAAIGQVLTIEKVVLTSIFFYILHANVCRDFPIALESTTNMFYSIQKIQAFLFGDDVPNRVKSGRWIPVSALGDNVGLRFCDVTVTSTFAGHRGDSMEDKDGTLLQNVDFAAAKGELICVAGPPKSGKTSLLLAAAGELSSTSGHVMVCGHVVFVPQESFIFTGTIRENIICHHEFNEEKFRNVIRVCRLQEEINDMEKGEMSFIYETCRYLLPDTRFRIKLARSLYTDADVFLFDDVFDDINKPENEDLFELIVRQYLKEKLCVVVTNKTEYIKMADKVILLQNGRVCTYTSYDNFTDTEKESASSCKDPQSGNTDSSDQQADQDNPFEEILEDQPVSSSNMFVILVSFLRFGGNALVLILLSGMLVLSQVTFHLSDWLLFDLVDDRRAVVLQPLQPDHQESDNVTQHFRVETTKTKSSIDSYFMCELAFVWFCLFSSLVLLLVLKNAMIRIHVAVVRGIVSNTKTWPARKVATLLKCVQTLDHHIMLSVAGMLDIFLPVCGILIFTVFVCPSVVMPTILYILFVVGITRNYAKTYRNLKHVEMKLKPSSKRYLLETIRQLVTLRAVNAVEGFHRIFLKQQNKKMSAGFIRQVTDSLLAGRIQFLSFVYLALVANFVFRKPELFAKDGIQIVLTFWAVIDSIPRLIQVLAEMQYQLPDLEWLLNVTRYKTSHQVTKVNVKRGKVLLHNVHLQTKLRQMQNVCINIQAGEKIAILGNIYGDLTLLVTSLAGLLPPTQGALFIDNLNVYLLAGLKNEVRNVLTYICLEPGIFSTTVLNNLDPNNAKSKAEIWDALDHVGLRSTVEALPKQLNSDIKRHLKLQPYQKYLIELARGILTAKKLVVIVDFYPPTNESRKLIHSTIKDKFANSTVVFITSKPCADLMVDFDNIYRIEDYTIHKLGE